MEIIIRGIWAWDCLYSGPKNVVADALSRLPKQGDIVDDVDAVLPFVPEYENIIFPVRLKEIQSYQTKDRELSQIIKSNPVYYQKKQ